MKSVRSLQLSNGIHYKSLVFMFVRPLKFASFSKLQKVHISIKTVSKKYIFGLLMARFQQVARFYIAAGRGGAAGAPAPPGIERKKN